MARPAERMADRPAPKSHFPELTPVETSATGIFALPLSDTERSAPKPE